MLDSSFDGSESEDAPDLRQEDAFTTSTDLGEEVEEQRRTGSSSDGYTDGAEVSDCSFGPDRVGPPSRSAESSVSGSVPSETPSREEQSRETVDGEAIDHGGEGGEGDSEDDDEPSNEAETADGETPKSRKRVKRVHRWKKSKRIKLGNSGRSYTSTKGKPVSALKHFLFYTFTDLLMCRSLHDTSMTHSVVYDVTRSCPLLIGRISMTGFGQQPTGA